MWHVATGYVNSILGGSMMAADKIPGAVNRAGRDTEPDASTVRGAKRTRKQYDHVLTEPEKFALQTVQRAQGALRTVNDAIKSGKPVSAEIVKLCLQFSQQAADMLFGKSL